MGGAGFDAFGGDRPDPGGDVGLGRYRPFRRLAVGGMAEIFLAYARSLHGFEKLVVLKRVLPQYAESAEFVAMFLDEARLAATLDHPNIVHVYDIGQSEGGCFFAMEYVHGQSLLKIMRQITQLRRWLPLEHALAIVIGTCAGLHYAHERHGLDGRPLGIVHRDVSPPNILISYDGAIKVADFGVAKAAVASAATGVGTLKGKVPYMSPEQCRSAPIDRRSDIFSIGILLYELTVGRRLFQADTEIAIIHKVVSGAIAPPSQLLRGYPEDLERIVFRALQLDPDRRYPTARAMQVDLEEFGREHKLPISSARLAAFMEELFDEDARRWPTGPEQAELQRPRMAADPPQAAAPSQRGSAGTQWHDIPEKSPVAPPAPAAADGAALDSALSRMLADDAELEALTSELAPPGTPSEWDGLDSLELEDLFPAKQKR